MKITDATWKNPTIKIQMNKLFSVTFIFLFLSCHASALDSSDLSNTGFYLQPDAIIKKINSKKAGYKEHFLLAISHKNTGNKKNAIHHFANSCFKYSGDNSLKLYPLPVYKYVNGFHIKSELYDDCMYEIASLFFDYREFEYVLKFIDLIDESGTALYRDAIILKANALMKTGKNDSALSLLNDILNKYNDPNSKSLILIRIASVYEQLNLNEKAVNAYFEILKIDNQSWQSGIACRRIMDISNNLDLKFNDNEKLILAVSLFHNSKKESLNIFEDLYSTCSDETRIKVLYYLLNAYISTGQLRNTDRILYQYKNDKSIYFNLLKIKADTLLSINRKSAAFKIYEKIYSQAGGELQKNSHQRIASYLLSNEKNYKDIIVKYINKYPEDYASHLFLWALAKDSLKEKDYGSAIDFLEKSLKIFPDGIYSAKKRYWLARLYSELEKNNQAEDILKQMTQLNPDSSYTWKALHGIHEKYKLTDLSANFNAAVKSRNQEDAIFSHALLLLKEKNFNTRNERIKSLTFVKNIAEYLEIDTVLNEPDFSGDFGQTLKGIEKYFAIGYSDGVNRELALIPDNEKYQIDKYKALAHFGAKYNNYYYASVSLLNLFNKKNIRENIAFLPVPVIKKLYPLAFSEYVEKYCTEYGIQKEVIYSVIKAESSFNPSAVSPVGATGLMQLMPATAADIAKGVDLGKFNLTKAALKNTSYLKNPEISVLFGIKYFSWLNKFLNSNQVNIIAGYNAGPGNVKKWEKENLYDEDFFIELIPFQETRHYVLRIQRFILMYNLLYN